MSPRCSPNEVSLSSRPWRLTLTAGLLSASVLAYEVALMRMLLVASWHHFAFLIISLALMGFAASGTVLALGRRWFERRVNWVLPALIAATAVAMPLCVQLAQHVPIEARFAPGLMREQLLWWSIYFLVLTVPFLLAAMGLGLMLIIARQDVPIVYAGNLLGSGVGALGVTGLMWCVPPAWLPVPISALAVASILSTPVLGCRTRLIAAGLTVLAVAGGLALDLPHIRADPFKYTAHVARLTTQGDAHRLAVTYSPRGQVEAYASESFHDLPFLSLGLTPPPMDAVLIDGHHVGSLLHIESSYDAEIVDQSLMAVPYVLSADPSRVALLDETTGRNIWLALRHGAAEVHAVQPNGNLLRLLRGPLAHRGGNVWDQPRVQAHRADPRHFIESGAERFDIVQLVSLEQLTAGSAGLGGLAENYLVTVQGLAACLGRLDSDGLVSATRGIQSPPRDNLKLLATFVEALRLREVQEPSRHVVILRDYLAVCTIVRPRPWSDAEIDQVRRLCEQRNLTPVWFPGIRPEELNQPDELPGPENEPGDWYHYGAGQLFGPQAQRFVDGWAFDIRPAIDDRPFFADFCRLRTLGEMRTVFGPMWLARIELAFLFVLVTAAVIGVLGALVTVVPLTVVSSAGPAGMRAVTIGYFGAIGLGFMMLEMTWISRLTQLIGDPLLAASTAIAGFLVFSGLGSLTAQRCRPVQESRLILMAALGVAVLAGLQLGGFNPLTQLLGQAGTPLRLCVALGWIAPLAYGMGFMMPLGLRRLDRDAPELVPWAWGVNGFTSVLAVPLTVAIGMAWGYSLAGGAAIALYIIAPFVMHSSRSPATDQ